jgi:outer membrane protein OmpA-like peptidoglycan-associated protein
MLNKAVLGLAGIASCLLVALPQAQAASPACSGASLTEEAMLGCLTGVGSSISNTSRGIRAGTPAGAPAGAPPEAPPPAAVDLEIKFAFGSAELSSAAKSTLLTLAHVMNASALASKSFRVIGHTDGVGSDEVNDALSVARAQAVSAFLAQQGIVPTRLTAAGVGKRDYKNPQDPGSAVNRRVEILPAG